MCVAAKIGVRGGPIDRIPRLISLFDRGRKLRLVIRLLAPEIPSPATVFQGGEFKFQNGRTARANHDQGGLSGAGVGHVHFATEGRIANKEDGGNGLSGTLGGKSEGQ